MKTVAMENGVHVRLLASTWKYTGSEQIAFLKSLNEFNGALHKKNGSIEVVRNPISCIFEGRIFYQYFKESSH